MNVIDSLDMEIYASIILLRQVAVQYNDVNLDIECENLHIFYEKELKEGWTSENIENMRINILNLHLTIIHNSYNVLVPLCQNLYDILKKVKNSIP